MPLQSALEDLKKTTLQKITGLLGRLDYLSRLREGNQGYRHWGLSRIHGEESAQQALSEAHQAAAADVLRTPLRRVVQDAEISSQAQGQPAEQYTEKLRDRGEKLLPPQPSAGSARHLKSVLRALSYLVKPR